MFVRKAEKCDGKKDEEGSANPGAKGKQVDEKI